MSSADAPTQSPRADPSPLARAGAGGVSARVWGRARATVCARVRVPSARSLLGQSTSGSPGPARRPRGAPASAGGAGRGASSARPARHPMFESAALRRFRRAAEPEPSRDATRPADTGDRPPSPAAMGAWRAGPRTRRFGERGAPGAIGRGTTGPRGARGMTALQSGVGGHAVASGRRRT